MKKIIALAAAAGFLAAPALAASMTIEFAPTEGDAQTWTFEASSETGGTYTAPDGSTGPYTWDAEALKLCGTTEAGEEMCAKFDEANEEPAVGDASGYTASDGTTGTATITAISADEEATE